MLTVASNHIIYGGHLGRLIGAPLNNINYYMLLS